MVSTHFGSIHHDSLCGRALRSGERIVIEDIETDGPYAPLREVRLAQVFSNLLINAAKYTQPRICRCCLRSLFAAVSSMSAGWYVDSMHDGAPMAAES
jgi:hypothetical protein